MTTILLILLGVYVLGVIALVWRRLADWRAALLWPLLLIAFALLWRHD